MCNYSVYNLEGAYVLFATLRFYLFLSNIIYVKLIILFIIVNK